MTVAETWGLRCPRCRDDRAVLIVCDTTLMLTPDGTEDIGSDEWSSNDVCTCGKCFHAALVVDFRIGVED